MKKQYLLVSLCLVTLKANAIVNLDSLHFENTGKGNSGELSLAVDGAKGNTDKSQITVDAQAKFNTERYANILLANYQYGESGNKKDTDKRFVHVRHINQIRDSHYAWELYAQSESNPFIRLSLRALFGGGIRYGFTENASNQHFLGIGVFYSRETLDPVTNLTDDGTTHVNRANFYALSRFIFSKTAKLYNTLYYQPDAGSSGDFRVFNIISLRVKVVKQLSLKTSVQVSHDSEPPLSVKKTDVSYSTAFVYSF